MGPLAAFWRLARRCGTGETRETGKTGRNGPKRARMEAYETRETGRPSRLAPPRAHTFLYLKNQYSIFYKSENTIAQPVFGNPGSFNGSLQLTRGLTHIAHDQ